MFASLPVQPILIYRRKPKPKIGELAIADAFLHEGPQAAQSPDGRLRLFLLCGVGPADKPQLFASCARRPPATGTATFITLVKKVQAMEPEFTEARKKRQAERAALETPAGLRNAK